MCFYRVKCIPASSSLALAPFSAGADQLRCSQSEALDQQMAHADSLPASLGFVFKGYRDLNVEGAKHCSRYCCIWPLDEERKFKISTEKQFGFCSVPGPLGLPEKTLVELAWYLRFVTFLTRQRWSSSQQQATDKTNDAAPVHWITLGRQLLHVSF